MNQQMLWASIFGASVAQQTHALISRGAEAPDDHQMDVIVEEAAEIANMAMKSINRSSEHVRNITDENY